MLTNQLTTFIIISEVRAYHYKPNSHKGDKEMENKKRQEKLRNLLSDLQELELELVESVLESVEDFDETMDDVTEYDDRIGDIHNVIEIISELIER